MADYIKREDVKHIINKSKYYGKKVWYDILEDVYDIPSADVAPVRHGRWIESTTDLICSACETVFNDEIAWMCRDYTFGYPKYCPYCGAFMDTEDNK